MCAGGGGAAASFTSFLGIFGQFTHTKRDCSKKFIRVGNYLPFITLDSTLSAFLGSDVNWKGTDSFQPGKNTSMNVVHL